MTNEDRNTLIVNSLFELRGTVEALSCVSALIPDNFDEEDGLAIGMLLKRLTERLEGDLTYVTNTVLKSL